MTAYLVADIEVTDPASYEDYKKGAFAAVEAYGGRYIARGGATEVLEGDWVPNRLVILEFPDGEKLRAWYESPEYKPFRDIRHRAANSRLVMVDGV